MMTPEKLDQLFNLAQDACASVRDLFRDGLGSQPTIVKADGGIATSTDLAIERILKEKLVEGSGIGVFGEETGGNTAVDTYWVVDPIDGTTNFATRSPMCAMLISLIHEGQPVFGLTDAPALGLTFTALPGDGGLYVNGLPHVPVPLHPHGPVPIGFGSLVSSMDSHFPTPIRQEFLKMLVTIYPRLRVTGSVGIDLAFAAAGTFGAAITFSPHIWDNAAGVALVRAAGGVVTDLNGDPWTTDSLGVVAGAPDVHAEIMATLGQLSHRM